MTTTTRDELLTIKQVAEITGLSAHTLRYYERVGLIHPINREDNTHRRYSQEDIGWIQFLMKLRATGMPIQAMQVYAELQRQGDATLPERVEMLKQLQRKVEMRMQELNEHLGLICYKIDLYSKLIEEGTAPEPVSLECTTERVLSSTSDSPLPRRGIGVRFTNAAGDASR